MPNKVMLVALSMAALLSSSCSRPAPAVAAGPGAEAGIEILGVELLAGGDLAALRYRVVDLPRASKALRGDVLLYAAASDRGLGVMSVGRLGPLRQRPAASGRREFILFTNTGRVLQRGSTATVAFDGRRIDGIPVL